MKKVKMKLGLSIFFALAVGAVHASPIVLDFEGVGNEAKILDFYNGGTDNQNHSGTDYGISFGTNALGVIDSEGGGSGGFANEPSGNTVMFFYDGSAVLNYAAGFDTGFSFFYTAAAPAIVNIYSGLNTTGALLASINLSAQYNQNCSGDPTGDFCNFSEVAVTFAGTARSIDFGGAAAGIGYDNITFGSATPGNNVPEPGSIALVGLGLLGMTAVYRYAPKRRG
jgi:hypothetical protein